MTTREQHSSFNFFHFQQRSFLWYGLFSHSSDVHYTKVFCVVRIVQSFLYRSLHKGLFCGTDRPVIPLSFITQRSFLWYGSSSHSSIVHYTKVFSVVRIVQSFLYRSLHKGLFCGLFCGTDCSVIPLSFITHKGLFLWYGLFSHSSDVHYTKVFFLWYGSFIHFFSDVQSFYRSHKGVFLWYGLFSHSSIVHYTRSFLWYDCSVIPLTFITPKVFVLYGKVFSVVRIVQSFLYRSLHKGLFCGTDCPVIPLTFITQRCFLWSFLWYGLFSHSSIVHYNCGKGLFCGTDCPVIPLSFITQKVFPVVRNVQSFLYRSLHKCLFCGTDCSVIPLTFITQRSFLWYGLSSHSSIVHYTKRSFLFIPLSFTNGSCHFSVVRIVQSFLYRSLHKGVFCGTDCSVIPLTFITQRCFLWYGLFSHFSDVLYTKVFSVVWIVQSFLYRSLHKGLFCGTDCSVIPLSFITQRSFLWYGLSSHSSDVHYTKVFSVVRIVQSFLYCSLHKDVFCGMDCSVIPLSFITQRSFLWYGLSSHSSDVHYTKVFSVVRIFQSFLYCSLHKDVFCGTDCSVIPLSFITQRCFLWYGLFSHSSIVHYTKVFSVVRIVQSFLYRSLHKLFSVVFSVVRIVQSFLYRFFHCLVIPLTFKGVFCGTDCAVIPLTFFIQRCFLWYGLFSHFSDVLYTNVFSVVWIVQSFLYRSLHKGVFCGTDCSVIPLSFITQRCFLWYGLSSHSSDVHYTKVFFCGTDCSVILTFFTQMCFMWYGLFSHSSIVHFLWYGLFSHSSIVHYKRFFCGTDCSVIPLTFITQRCFSVVRIFSHSSIVHCTKMFSVVRIVQSFLYRSLQKCFHGKVYRFSVVRIVQSFLSTFFFIVHYKRCFLWYGLFSHSSIVHYTKVFSVVFSLVRIVQSFLYRSLHKLFFCGGKGLFCFSVVFLWYGLFSHSSIVHYTKVFSVVRIVQSFLYRSFQKVFSVVRIVQSFLYRSLHKGVFLWYGLFSHSSDVHYTKVFSVVWIVQSFFYRSLHKGVFCGMDCSVIPLSFITQRCFLWYGLFSHSSDVHYTKVFLWYGSHSSDVVFKGVLVRIVQSFLYRSLHKRCFLWYGLFSQVHFVFCGTDCSVIPLTFFSHSSIVHYTKVFSVGDWIVLYKIPLSFIPLSFKGLFSVVRIVQSFLYRSLHKGLFCGTDCSVITLTFITQRCFLWYGLFSHSSIVHYTKVFSVIWIVQSFLYRSLHKGVFCGTDCSVIPLTFFIQRCFLWYGLFSHSSDVHYTKVFSVVWIRSLHLVIPLVFFLWIIVHYTRSFLWYGLFSHSSIVHFTSFFCGMDCSVIPLSFITVVRKGSLYKGVFCGTDCSVIPLTFFTKGVFCGMDCSVIPLSFITQRCFLCHSSIVHYTKVQSFFSLVRCFLWYGLFSHSSIVHYTKVFFCGTDCSVIPQRFFRSLHKGHFSVVRIVQSFLYRSLHKGVFCGTDCSVIPLSFITQRCFLWYGLFSHSSDVLYTKVFSVVRIVQSFLYRSLHKGVFCGTDCSVIPLTFITQRCFLWYGLFSHSSIVHYTKVFSVVRIVQSFLYRSLHKGLFCGTDCSVIPLSLITQKVFSVVRIVQSFL
ncbi:unnamed protein product [Acanthosepion pharaonis]|uniref:Uncharacterized protein n=1 Tax=Acanthosepion pharaonis TaxID=158019 RepID=A0A812CEF6_ACAPH|nr:unnamed protein product [Sepia pharaonis]